MRDDIIVLHSMVDERAAWAERTRRVTMSFSKDCVAKENLELSVLSVTKFIVCLDLFEYINAHRSSRPYSSVYIDHENAVY